MTVTVDDLLHAAARVEAVAGVIDDLLTELPDSIAGTLRGAQSNCTATLSKIDERIGKLVRKEGPQGGPLSRPTGAQPTQHDPQ